MHKEIIHTHSGEEIYLTISPEGYCFCPVCGVMIEDADWRPYYQNGLPSYDICSCGFQFGYDDGSAPSKKSWAGYRERWLQGKVKNEKPPILSLSQKKQQLKNIGL